MRRCWKWAGLFCAACGDAPPLPAGGVPEPEASRAELPATGPAAPRDTAAGGIGAAATGAADPSLAPPASSPAPTSVAADLPSDATTLVVSLTFDDTFASQLEAARILEAHGLRGTFYVNSPRLYDGSARPGVSQYMSVADALALQARGHDIGGHTLGHTSLTALPEPERFREILVDRAELLRLGFEARSFAYPRGDVEADDPSLGRPVLEITRGSGYASARDTNGFGLGGCEPAPEGVPPLDAYLIRSIRSVNDAPPVASGEPPAPPDSTATLLGWMDHTARCGGGWLPLIFHHLRVDCSAPDGPGSYCFDYAELEALAAALAAGARCPEGEPCYRIDTRTVTATLGAAPVAPAAGVPFALANPSLERTLASGNTECFQAVQGSGGTALLGRSTEVARSGAASLRMELSEPVLASAEVRITRDFGACALFTTAGSVYDLSLHYRAEPGPEAVSLRFVTARLTAGYTWETWESSEPFSALSPGEWVEHSFRTGPVPSDTLAFSFGLRQESAGVVHVDDFDGVPVVAPAVP